MKVFKYLIFSLFLLVAAVGIVGLFLPDTLHVEREITIDAPAEKIFPYLNDFRKFKLWSPWVGLDPATEYSYSGADTGVGAKFKWQSTNKDIGSGSQEIIESEQFTSVKALLRMGKNDLAMSSFRLEDAGAQTRLIWSFDINFNGTVSRYFGLMMGGWVGSTYEQSLKKLKRMVEGA